MKRFISIIIILIFALNITGYANENKQYYILIEASTGFVVQSENADVPVPIGNLVKLMTYLIIAENLESGDLQFNTIVTASANVFGMKGASIWLSAGEQMTAEDLIKASVIGNANDATAALAEKISGSQEKFVMDMNARAFDLGMRNTIFTDCTGLDDSQMSTAYDISLLCRELQKHKSLTPFFTCFRDFIRDGDTELVNENKLVRSYDGITGLKASHSKNSGFNLALSAYRNGKTFIAVVLNTDDDNRFTTAKNLLSTGFSSYAIATPLFSSEFMKPLEVRGGIDRAVEFEPLALSPLLVQAGKTDEIECVMFLPDYLTAPVKQGQKIGSAAFYLDNTLLYETPIITKSAVRKFTYKDALWEITNALLS